MLLQRQSILLAIFAILLSVLSPAWAMNPVEPAQYCRPTGSSGYAQHAKVYGLWDLSQPISFYLPRYCKGGGRCRHQEAFLWALELWRQSTGGMFSYKLCDRPEEAQVQVAWVTTKIDNLPEDIHPKSAPPCRGLTSCNARPDELNPVNISGTITLEVPEREIGGYDESCFQNACLHELGHLLGILGHSPNSSDIMYATTNPKTRLSSADIDTLLYLYRTRARVVRERASFIDSQLSQQNGPVKVASENPSRGNSMTAMQYMQYVGNTVQQHWHPPLTLTIPLTIPVRFTIGADGRMGSIFLTGDATSIPNEYVQAAITALTESASFERPSPDVVRDWGGDHATVNMSLNYMPPQARL